MRIDFYILYYNSKKRREFSIPIYLVSTIRHHTHILLVEWNTNNIGNTIIMVGMEIEREAIWTHNRKRDKWQGYAHVHMFPMHILTRIGKANDHILYCNMNRVLYGFYRDICAVWYWNMQHIQHKHTQKTTTTITQRVQPHQLAHTRTHTHKYVENNINNWALSTLVFVCSQQPLTYSYRERGREVHGLFYHLQYISMPI